MNGAMPVPGPIRISGVDMLDGKRNSCVGFGKMCTVGSFDVAEPVYAVVA